MSIYSLFKFIGGRTYPVSPSTSGQSYTIQRPAGQRHNRYLATITSAHTGVDLEPYAVTFTSAQNVRRYRIFASQAGRIVEDAPNGSVASGWLADPSSNSSAAVEHIIFSANDWTSWQSVSEDPADTPLLRLDFQAESATITSLRVEATSDGKDLL